MSDPITLFGLPDDLRAQVVRAAEADDTTPHEWVQRAVVRQLDERAWREVLTYGEQRARTLGYAEDDVEQVASKSREKDQASVARLCNDS